MVLKVRDASERRLREEDFFFVVAVEAAVAADVDEEFERSVFESTFPR